MDVKEIIEKNNLKTREDINAFMREFVGEVMQQMLDKEFDEHMGYEKGKKSTGENSRNGKSIPIYSIMFGSAAKQQLQDMATLFSTVAKGDSIQ